MIVSWLRKDHRQGHTRVADVRVKKMPPLFLTINCTESPDALHQMEVLRRRLGELGSEATFHMDNEPRGHKVTLVPEILEGMDAYLHRQLK